MSAVLWILVAVAAALALYAAGAIGWALGRRASQDGGAGSAMPVLAEVPARTGAAVLVALDNLPELLDRRDVLVINTVSTGIDPRAEVVDVAVLDTTERHGLKRMPATDWACLMRRYTETTSGRDASWIELAAARTREGLAAPATHWAMEDAHTALELLRILAHREAAEVR